MNRVLVKDLMERLNQADPNASVELKGADATFEVFDVLVLSPASLVTLRFAYESDPQLMTDDAIVQSLEDHLSLLELQIASIENKGIADLIIAVREAFDKIRSELP